MNEAVVVLTYPGHYLLTALTIQTYYQHHPDVPLTVIVDDASQYAWPTYVEDCARLYNVQPITTSSFAWLEPFNRVPWVKQQLVKLHLDQIVSFKKWLFIDGDIVFHTQINNLDTVVPYAPFTWDEKQNAYIGHLLGIPNPGIWTKAIQVGVSHLPVRSMSADTLVALRQHIETLHKKTLLELHQEITKLPRELSPYSVSEWELIENFKQHLLNEKLDLRIICLNQIGESHASDVSTCYCSDSELGRAWFEEQGLTVSDEVWTTLSKIHK